MGISGGIDGGNSLGSLFFNHNPLFGLRRELREEVAKGIHILYLVCGF
jgi:hypothetical protein